MLPRSLSSKCVLWSLLLSVDVLASYFEVASCFHLTGSYTYWCLADTVQYCVWRALLLILSVQ